MQCKVKLGRNAKYEVKLQNAVRWDSSLRSGIGEAHEAINSGFEKERKYFKQKYSRGIAQCIIYCLPKLLL